MIATITSGFHNVSNTVQTTINDSDARARIVTKVAVPVFAGVSAYSLLFGASLAFTATAVGGLAAFYLLYKAVNKGIGTSPKQGDNQQLFQAQARYEQLLESTNRTSAANAAEIQSLNKQLEEAIKRKESEVTKIRQEVESLREQIAQVTKEKDAQLSTVGQLQDKLEQAESVENAALDTSRKSKAELERIRGEFAQSEARIAELENEIARLQKELEEDDQRDIQEDNDDIVKAQTRLEEIKARKEEHTSKSNKHRSKRKKTPRGEKTAV